MHAKAHTSHPVAVSHIPACEKHKRLLARIQVQVLTHYSVQTFSCGKHAQAIESTQHGLRVRASAWAKLKVKAMPLGLASAHTDVEFRLSEKSGLGNITDCCGAVLLIE